MLPHFTTCLLASALAAGLIAFCPQNANAQVVKPAEPGVAVVDHKTLYLAVPIEGVHRFEIRAKLHGNEGTGSLLLDKNKCEINEFGDRITSQLMAFKPTPITLRQIEEDVDDPSPDRNRRVFTITATNGERPLPNLVLMVPEEGPPRLIHLGREGERRAVTLEPIGAYDALAK